jgi:enterochelin esterase-like enzyme
MRFALTSVSLAVLPVVAATATDAAPAPMPEPSVGRLERLSLPPSRWVDARPVDVWLPEGYEQAVQRGQRFQVLYVHDGQMMFDARTTWNHQAWGLDKALSRLVQAGSVAPTLVVAVWNNGDFRHSEYFPQAFLDLMPGAARQRHLQEALHDKPQGDAYLRFLVEELKPLVDKRYATLPDPAHTAIMGSSMGGLISVYALCRYPQVFGAAAGLSTHWVGRPVANAAIPLAGMRYLQAHLPDPHNHRLYQDHGTVELDALYAPYQAMVDQVVHDAGYDERHYRSLVFEGAGHNENAWAQRLEQPLSFILQPP